MELQAYLSILWRRKWTIVLTTLIIAVGVAVATYLATPIYVSTTTLRAITIGGDALSGRTDPIYTERLLNTYATIVTGGASLNELKKQLDLSEKPVISVELVRGTELMKIRAEAINPETARSLADAAAEIVIRQSREQFSGGGQSTQDIIGKQLEQIESELADARKSYEELAKKSPEDKLSLSALSQSIQLKERTHAGLLEQYETARVNEALRANSIYIVEHAQLPTNPSSPRADINLILGILSGLVAGVVLAFLFENLDNTLRTREQIESIAESTAIGEIPASRNKLEIVHANNGHHPQIEAFRRLRINILATENETPAQTILITSAERAEGKTTVAANLAVTIAQSGRRVIVVDCDMHWSKLDTLFGVRNDKGLTSILTGQVSVAGGTQDTKIPRLKIITSGPPLAQPLDNLGPVDIAPVGLTEQLSQGTELLGSPKMATILKQLKQDYDVILLDSPAMLSVTDAAVLVPLVDEVVLVVAREHSQRSALRSVRRQLENVRAKSIDVVINRAG
jgi:non-specific protein-tyrosine kinase